MMRNYLLLCFLIVIFSKQFTFLNQDQQIIAQQIIYKFAQKLNLSQQLNDQKYKVVNPICLTCHTVIKNLKQVPLAKSTIYSILEQIGTYYCTYKKIQIRSVCQGAVDQMTEYILKSLIAHYTDPHLICHQLRLCPKEYEILTYANYQKQILANKPNKTQQNPTGSKILNLLHISDIHPDVFYQEGSPTICDLPGCCRKGVKALQGSQKAGFWGSLAECDVPIPTFNLFLEKIQSEKIDLVIWTGDNVAHDIWKQSQAYNNNFTTLLSNLMKRKIKAPIYPTKGNHQSYPVNVYQFGNQQQLNNGLADAWSSFIGDQATQMLREKGYFSVINQKLNLKVISLNTQSGNNQNWVLIKDPTDPGSQLEWMRAQLDKSQKINQLVYIIGHIPPHDMLNQWGIRYNALIDRYNYIIRGQFYGHTHNDHMGFFTAINDKTNKIHNTYMMAPSFTTSTYRNPKYRIVKIDQDTMRVLDYTQYFLNLTKYQTSDVVPQFQIDYNFLNQYQFDSFSFENLEKFRQQLKTDPKIQEKYTFHQYGGIKKGFTGAQIECSTRPTRQLNAVCMGSTYTPSTFEKAAGPWRKLKHNE